MRRVKHLRQASDPFRDDGKWPREKKVEALPQGIDKSLLRYLLRCFSGINININIDININLNNTFPSFRGVDLLCETRATNSNEIVSSTRGLKQTLPRTPVQNVSGLEKTSNVIMLP